MFAAGFFAGPLEADTRAWAGGTGSWFTAANWNPTPGVPDADDEVHISGGTPQITTPGAVSGQINVGYILDGSLNISGTGTLTSSLSYIGGGTIGSATVSGSGVWNTGELRVAYFSSGGSGTLTISSGGKVNADMLRLSDQSTSSTNTGNINVDAGTLAIGAQILMGNASRGLANINITNGGTVSSTYAVITGSNTGAANKVTVNGSGSVWNASGDIDISGSGVLPEINILNGGTVNVSSGAGTLDLGRALLNIGNGAAAGTLNAATVDGSGDGTVNFNHTDTAVFSASVINNVAINKSSNSTTILTGTNTYTGATTISAGTLQIGNGSATGSLGSTAVTNSATLVFNRTGNVAIDAAISGTGVLIQSGSGTTALTGASTYTGATTISAGTLQIGNGGTTGSLGTTTISNSATLAFNRTDAFTFASTVTGTGTILQAGTGNTALTGTANTAGSLVSNLGTLTIQSGGNLTTTIGRIAETAGSNGQVVVSGSGSLWTNTGTIYAGNVGTGVLTIQAGGDVTSVGSSRIGDAATGVGTVTVTGLGSSWINTGDIVIGNHGNGTLNIQNQAFVNNTYARIGESSDGTGAATVDGTSSVWSNSGDLYVGNSATGTLTVQNNGTVTSVGSSRIGDKAGVTGTATVTGTGSSWTNNGQLIVGTNGTGTLNVANGGLVSATTTLLGSASGSTGTLNLSATSGNSGVLQTGQIIKGSGTSTITFNGGTLRATGNQASMLSGFSTGDVQLTGNGALIDTNGFTVGISTALGGSGGLTKLGAGTLTLSGTSSYSNATIINGGTLALTGNITTGVHVGNNGFTGNVTITGTLNATGFLTVGDNDGSPTPGGTGTLTIGSGGIVAMSSGARVTIGWTDATGTLNLNTGGTLKVGATNGIRTSPTGVANFNFAGGTIQVVNLNLTSAVPMTLSSTTSTIDTNGLAATFSGVLSGSGALTKSGNGTLTLSAANTYTGATTVSAGSLAINGSLAGAVSIGAGGTLGGTGSIGGLGTINGTLAPGNSAGLILFDDDLTLNTSSFTSIEIGGLAPISFDRISVGDALAYGGTLSLSFLGGFTPQVGDTFQLFQDFDSQSGTFTSIGFSNPSFAGNFDYATGTLTVVAIPEPSTYALCLAGLLALLIVIQHNRTTRKSKTLR